MVKLTTNDLFQIGINLSNELSKHNVIIDNILNIKVDSESFKKIDEDLYYRNNKDGNDFTPSFSEINVKFPHLNIVISKSNV